MRAAGRIRTCDLPIRNGSNPRLRIARAGAWSHRSVAGAAAGTDLPLAHRRGRTPPVYRRTDPARPGGSVRHEPAGRDHGPPGLTRVVFARMPMMLPAGSCAGQQVFARSAPDPADGQVVGWSPDGAGAAGAGAGDGDGAGAGGPTSSARIMRYVATSTSPRASRSSRIASAPVAGRAGTVGAHPGAHPGTARGRRRATSQITTPTAQISRRIHTPLRNSRPHGAGPAHAPPGHTPRWDQVLRACRDASGSPL